MTTTAIYGVGSMGGAILEGLVAGGEGEVLAIESGPDRVAQLRDRFAEEDRVHVVEATDAAQRADIHLILVKPYAVPEVLAAIGPSLRPGAVVVSLALGVSLTDLHAQLPAGTAVIRGMPNTPAGVGQGMTVLSPDESVTDEQIAAVEAVLAPTGGTLVLPESQQDAATALSGSAPAYFFLVVEALVDAGVALGLSRPDARALAGRAALGAGAMLVETGEEPAILRTRVTSPGGSTALALARLEEHGVRHAFADAATACADRSAGR